MTTSCPGLMAGGEKVLDSCCLSCWLVSKLEGIYFESSAVEICGLNLSENVSLGIGSHAGRK